MQQFRIIDKQDKCWWCRSNLRCIKNLAAFSIMSWCRCCNLGIQHNFIQNTCRNSKFRIVINFINLIKQRMHSLMCLGRNK